jgi:cation transport regulator ChaC
VTPAEGCLWYFAYGSNLCPETFTGRRALAPRAAHAAWLDHFALRFDLPVGPGERGVANLACVPGARTWGVAYEISVDDALRLDRSEGVHRGWYDRVAVSVRRPEAREPITAFTYQSRFAVLGRKPSGRYLALLLDGARHHGLPGEWIAWLESLELAVDERTAS